jgi:hypothetical protein
MAEVQLSLGDMFINVCDIYLDSVSCKKYACSMFSQVPFNNEVSAFDSREEDLSMTSARGDDSESLRFDNAEENPSLSNCVRPLLPPAYATGLSNSDESVRRGTVIRRSGIFRTKQLQNESEYSEFCKLCRCSAWSKDSQDSGVVEELSDGSMLANPTEARLVHWDDIISESLNIRTRPLETERES